jgi:oligoendopeptidase F
MTLDLLDRKNKYSNGFCHWPQPAWVRPDGSWQPSRTNFTSLADPAAVGSGKTALTTLMHEAGHAAHFANIEMPSPLFSQVRCTPLTTVRGGLHCALAEG